MRKIKYPGLTEKQERMLDYIREFTTNNGFPPSHAEIAEEFNMIKQGPVWNVKKMLKLGYLNRVQVGSSVFIYCPKGIKCPFCDTLNAKEIKREVS